MQSVAFCSPIFPFVLGFFPVWDSYRQSISFTWGFVLCLVCPIVLQSWLSILLASLCGHLFGCCGIEYLAWACDDAVVSYTTSGGP